MKLNLDIGNNPSDWEKILNHISKNQINKIGSYPDLYQSKIKYNPNQIENFIDTRETYLKGFGDCEDLSIIRAAELNKIGIPAKVGIIRTGKKLYHAIVTDNQGNFLEDPTKNLLIKEQLKNIDPYYNFNSKYSVIGIPATFYNKFNIPMISGFTNFIGATPEESILKLLNFNGKVSNSQKVAGGKDSDGLTGLKLIELLKLTKEDNLKKSSLKELLSDSTDTEKSQILNLISKSDDKNDLIKNILESESSKAVLSSSPYGMAVLVAYNVLKDPKKRKILKSIGRKSVRFLDRLLKL